MSQFYSSNRNNNSNRNQYRGGSRNFRKKAYPVRSAGVQIIAEIMAQKKINNLPIVAPMEVTMIKNSFHDFALSDQLLHNIVYKKYSQPTPIQDQAIPSILEGRDVVGIANTGTGKTAAFLIPLIHKVLTNRNEKIFILAPTRELALQIFDELNSFAFNLRINSALCFGGTNIYKQKQSLRRNPNFVIGTPGRIKDLIKQRALSLSDFRTVVLDETDRMVDIGFIEDIKYFIELLPQNRQSLFFSATVSPKIKEIISAFVKNPVTISVKKEEIQHNIAQELIQVERGRNKIDILHDLLIKDDFKKVLIFGRTKARVEKLSQELIDRGFKAGSIHGNKRQTQRERVLRQFKTQQINILLATDVASRGLDIKEISHVINYDMPETYDDYIHRIGRTGRADKSGVALTFSE